MTEEQLRALVRDTVARHLGRAPITPEQRAIPAARAHASHILLAVQSGDVLEDGMCLIEPAVRCNHCGYCQSMGH